MGIKEFGVIYEITFYWILTKGVVIHLPQTICVMSWDTMCVLWLKRRYWNAMSIKELHKNETFFHGIQEYQTAGYGVNISW